MVYLVTRLCIIAYVFALTMACKVMVDSIEFDLSPLMNIQSHFWTNKYTGISYEATLCNSADRMMPKSCHAVNDVVAIQSGSCKYYGRYDSEQMTAFIDDNTPMTGVMIAYGNGVPCQSSSTGQSSVVFMITCDKKIDQFDDMLYNVESSLDECQHIYSFRSAAGCGYATSSSSNTSNKSSMSVTFIIFLTFLCICVVYCIGSVVYKQYVYGSSGWESVPHIDSLRSIYHSMESCCDIIHLRYQQSGAPDTVDHVYNKVSTSAATVSSYMPPIANYLGQNSKSKTADKYVLLYDAKQASMKTNANTNRQSGGSNNRAMKANPIDEEDEEETIEFGTNL